MLLRVATSREAEAAPAPAGSGSAGGGVLPGVANKGTKGTERGGLQLQSRQVYGSRGSRARAIGSMPGLPRR